MVTPTSHPCCPARDKRADADFASAVQNMDAARLRNEALGDVTRTGLTALGVGAAGAGALGLYNVLRRNWRKKTRSGPAELAMPFPVKEAGWGSLSDNQKRELLTAAGVTAGGGLVGGAFSALDAPKGHKWEGALRGAVAGAPLGLSGYALVSGMKGLANPQPGTSPWVDAAKATAGLTGSDALVWGGKSLPRMLFGRPSWEVRTDNLEHHLSKRETEKAAGWGDLSPDQKRELLTAAGVMAGGGLVGGGISALDAPKGHKWQGALGGAVAGVPLGLMGYALADSLKAKFAGFTDFPVKEAGLRLDALRRVLGTLGRGLGAGAASGGGTGIGTALVHSLVPTAEPLATGLTSGFGAAGGTIGNELGGQVNNLLTGTRYAQVGDLAKRLLPVAGTAGGGGLAYKLLHKEGDFKDFLGGSSASSPTGIPWYMPAMALGGAGGLMLGWKGTNALLERQRKAEAQAELDRAREEFHDVLLSSYDKPLGAVPPSRTARLKAAEAGRGLDTLFDRLVGVLEKSAIDWGDLAGKGIGGYGLYGGATGLLAGAIAYNQIKKRSRQAILEKALQRRERRRFMQSPTEIYATPEGVPAGPEEEEGPGSVPAV